MVWTQASNAHFATMQKKKISGKKKTKNQKGIYSNSEESSLVSKGQ